MLWVLKKLFMKILIAGDGGQGVQTIAKIISEAAFEFGREVSLVPNYGVEQRGGMSLAYLQIDSEPIVYQKFSRPDLLILMSAKARPRVLTYLSKSKKIWETEKYLLILKEKNLPAQSYNMLVLGLLAKILSKEKMLDLAKVKTGIEKKLKGKNGFAENLAAFELGTKV